MELEMVSCEPRTINSEFHLSLAGKPKLPCAPDFQNLRPGRGKLPSIAPQFSSSGPHPTLRPNSSESTRNKQSSHSSRR